MLAAGNDGETARKKHFKPPEQRAAVAELLKGSNMKVLRKGYLNRVGTSYGQFGRLSPACARPPVKKNDDGVVDPDLRNNRKSKSGQKRIDLKPVHAGSRIDLLLKAGSSSRGWGTALGPWTLDPRNGHCWTTSTNLGLLACACMSPVDRVFFSFPFFHPSYDTSS